MNSIDIKNLLDTINHSFTLFIVFPIMISFGIYLTTKLRCMQISQLKLSISLLTKTNKSSEGNISRFEAISTVLAGNFGTGNISGMAVALSVGGPGALVWMWVMAFFGAAIQYASCLLSVTYRSKVNENEFAGGPMYYLKQGLGFKKTAILFASFTILGSITVGNFAQINSVVLPLDSMGMNPFYWSIAIAAFTGIVILGGINRIGKFASFIVPLKAFLYLGTAFVVLMINSDKIIPAFNLMIQSAFDFNSFAGGIAGAGVLRAISTGFERGLFATDAGTGLVPILQASARTENPVMDGVATLIAPLMVMVGCTMTGLVLITTGAWQVEGLQSTNMVIHAFTTGLGSTAGGYIVIASLLMFAYTSVMAWAYCGEKAFGFIVGDKKAHWFRLLFIVIIPLGSIFDVSMIWTLADISITLMLITNLVGVIGLSSQVIASSRKVLSNE